MIIEKNFGKWFNNSNNLSISNNPFDHLIIDNFFDEEFAFDCYQEILKFKKEKFWIYKNSFEIQYVMNQWDSFGEKVYTGLFSLSSARVLEIFQDLFHIQRLIPDMGLHGGGVVMYPDKGKLNVHLDYETHPKLNILRQLNILVYLNPNWEKEWGGELGLYEFSENKLIQKEQVYPQFNRALIFNTNQNSWHGMPNPITCPKDQMRTAFNFYYLNPKEKGINNRFRAKFVPTDDQLNENPNIYKEAEKRMDLDNPEYRS